MPDTFDTWKADATEERIPVEICLDRALLGELSVLIDELADAKAVTVGMLEGPDGVLELEQRIVELNERRKAATKTLWFRSLPGHEWEALAAAHPPTAEQKELDARVDVNLETFQPAVVAACCVDPGLTVEQAVWLRDFLPRDEWMRVWGAARRANVEGSSIPKSVSSIVDRLGSELSSIGAAELESLSQSSEDGS